MGDYAHGWMVVLDCPDARLPDVLPLLEEAGVEFDEWIAPDADGVPDSGAVDHNDAVTVGTTYNAEAARLDFCQKVVQALATIRGCGAWCGQDSYAEYLPSGGFVHPDGRLWWGDADDFGSPIVSTHKILDMIEEAERFDPDADLAGVTEIAADLQSGLVTATSGFAAGDTRQVNGRLLVDRLRNDTGIALWEWATARTAALNPNDPCEHGYEVTKPCRSCEHQAARDSRQDPTMSVLFKVGAHGRRPFVYRHGRVYATTSGVTR